MKKSPKPAKKRTNSAKPKARAATRRKSPAPAAPLAAEEIAFVSSLVQRGEAVVTPLAGPLPSGATHTLVTKADGVTTVKRQRFSAW